jgi:hypothetical protein
MQPGHKVQQHPYHWIPAVLIAVVCYRYSTSKREYVSMMDCVEVGSNQYCISEKATHPI